MTVPGDKKALFFLCGSHASLTKHMRATSTPFFFSFLIGSYTFFNTYYIYHLFYFWAKPHLFIYLLFMRSFIYFKTSANNSSVKNFIIIIIIIKNINKNIFNNFLIAESRRTAPTFFKNCLVPHPQPHPHPSLKTHPCFIAFKIDKGDNDSNHLLLLWKSHARWWDSSLSLHFCVSSVFEVPFSSLMFPLDWDTSPLCLSFPHEQHNSYC